MNSESIDIHPELTYDRPFRTLFEDGVYLLRAAEQSDDIEESNSLARGSIVCTMMLPEVVANICIESLQLDRTIYNEIDKLTPLGKFDYFLKCKYKNRSVPIGILPVQKIQELKRLRDTFVHPKRFQVFWKPSSENDGSYIGKSKRTQFLDMSTNPTMWGIEDAIKAMQGAHEFLSYFFIELCRLSKRKTTNLLFSDEEIVGIGETSYFYYKYSFHLSLKKWNINTKYFRIGML